MKQVFIGKAIKYAASKTSATFETATTPDLLADGAIGVYGLCNDGKTRLISNVTASSSTIALLANFTANGATYGGSKVMVCRGVAVPSVQQAGQFYQGFVVTSTFNYRTATATTKTKENEQPLKNMWFVGYDPISATGLLNLPTAVQNDTLQLGIKTRTVFSPEENVYSYDVALDTAQSAYDSIKELVDNINADTKGIVVADIVGALGTEVTPVQATGSYIFTKGSTSITNASATATTVIAGDYLRIMNKQPVPPTDAVIGTSVGTNTITAPMTAANSTIYKVTAVGTNGVSITLDRAYTGETQTITVANFNLWVKRITALTTSLGIRLISGFVNTRIYPYVGQLNNLSSASVKEERGPSTGSGTYDMTVALEKLASPYSGQLNKMDGALAYTKPFPIYADTAVDNYDFYFTTVTPTNENSNVAQSALTSGLPFEFAVAFPTAASSTGDNQFVYDTIMASLTTQSGDVVVGS